jgi:molecular chaperone HscB
MEYFKLFDIEPGFTIDAKALKIKYLKLSKACHPDFHTDASPMEQVKILEQSTKLNKAYKTLKEPKLLLQYVLDAEGLLSGKPDELPQDFLFEMMSFNERIMELRMEPDPVAISEIQSEFSTIQNELKAALLSAMNDYDDQKSNEMLKKLRFLYFKQKYLSRIEEHMDKLGDFLT